MKQNSIKYLFFLLGAILIIYAEIYSNSLISVIGLFFLVVGLYIISKGIGQKPDYNPYEVQTEDEEE
ncbi:hypothetical protein OAO52_01530 [Flavobacteriaceae bacterium]|nr:hypothetical protein [Flavobacteriaceae bacterium]